MKKIDYWFLNFVKDFPNPFSLIITYDRCQELYDNRYKALYNDIDIFRVPSTLNTNQIAEIVYGMFQDELISAITSTDLEELESLHTTSITDPNIDQLLTRSFKPSFREIRIALESEETLAGQEYDRKETLYYFLTLQGGELWESIFKPKWNQYLTRRGNGINQIIDCVDPTVAQKLISIEYLISFDNENTYYYIPGTEIWETLSPWQVLYWKTLPIGYSVSYQTKQIEVDKSTESKELREEIRQAEEWLIDNWNWCTREYFDDWLTESNQDN